MYYVDMTAELTRSRLIPERRHMARGSINANQMYANVQTCKSAQGHAISVAQVIEFFMLSRGTVLLRNDSQMYIKRDSDSVRWHYLELVAHIKQAK